MAISLCTCTLFYATDIGAEKAGYIYVVMLFLPTCTYHVMFRCGKVASAGGQ